MIRREFFKRLIGIGVGLLVPIAAAKAVMRDGFTSYINFDTGITFTEKESDYYVLYTTDTVPLLVLARLEKWKDCTVVRAEGLKIDKALTIKKAEAFYRDRLLATQDYPCRDLRPGDTFTIEMVVDD